MAGADLTRLATRRSVSETFCNYSNIRSTLKGPIMARRTITQLVDDIDGTELKPGEGYTITFALGNTKYELDLGDENLGKFYDAIKPYTDVARKVGSGGGRTNTARRAGAAGNLIDTRAVRAWAESKGISVSPRGRVPAAVIQQYRAAGN